MFGRMMADWGVRFADWLCPPVCEVCGATLTLGERHACTGCLASLPRTRFHLCPGDNDIHHRLADNHILVDRAVSMFHYYRQAPSTNLILSAKYRSRPSVMSYLGEMYGREISQSGFFDGMDLIVPVPVHWTRRLTRGYNQTEYLARGLSRVAGITVDRSLLRLPSRHSTQTRRGVAERASNVEGTFTVSRRRASAIAGRGRHLLLVDDIITTGATMRDCLRALHAAIPDARLSVLSLGLAHLH